MLKKNRHFRCNGCDRIQRRCLCEFRPKGFFESDQLWANQEFKLYVVQSASERDHYKNTSTFLKFMAKNYFKILISLPSHHVGRSQQIREWKVIDELISTELKSEQDLVLLYPNTEQSQTLIKSKPTIEMPQDLKKKKHIAFVLLDMTWGHSKRLLVNSSALKQIPRLSLETWEIESSQSKVSLFFRDSVVEKQGLDKLCYGMIRNGKRKANEINSFESVVYTLLNYRLMNLEQINPVWTQYQYWLEQMSSECRAK